MSEHVKQFKVSVNGRDREVALEALTFEEVAALAYPDAPKDDSVLFTILFHHADQKPADGKLIPGGSVKIKNNTSFDVTKTIRS